MLHYLFLGITISQNHDIKYVYKNSETQTWLCGAGSFAKVFRGFPKTNLNAPSVAVKEFFSSISKPWIAEVNALAELTGHQNITRLLFSGFNENKQFCMVTDLSKESLEVHLIKKGKRLSFRRMRSLFIQITEAIRFMKKKNFIHLDMKPSNILVHIHAGKQELIFKLCDFGTSKKINKLGSVVSKTGTIGYMAPEILKENPKNTSNAYQADLWSFGKMRMKQKNQSLDFKIHRNEKTIVFL